MKDILLSICISSYNRGKICTELVRNILGIQDDRYNIFICDDCSDDREFAELLTVRNDKVSLIRNEKNEGACPNWYRTVNCGDGQYILHILDRDQIFVDYIISLLDLLENNPIAGGYVGMSAINLTHTVGGDTVYEVLKKGRDAFVAMAGVPVHPTGFLVNREYWKRGNFKRFFYNQQKYGIYPHSYVLGELATQADMLHMPVVLWKSSYRGSNRYSHFYEKSDWKEYWWLPDNVIKAANSLILYLYPLAGDEYKEEFLRNRLRECIYRSTIGYRSTVAKKTEMDHYRLKVSNVSKSKMILILLKYRIIFSHISKKIGRKNRLINRLFVSAWKQGFYDILRIESGVKYG